jgi:hypothetical protein
MTPETTLLNYALRMLSEGRWGGFCLLIAIWLVYRQRRYSSALSARQQQREMRLVNETWKTAFETVLREQPRRLRDLVEDTESESSHTP